MAWHSTSRHERGYGAKWDRTRKRILERDGGVCQPCLKKGIVHPGTEVDHIVSKARAKELRWTQEKIEADDNLQAINKECHKAKTAEESGKALRPKATIGPDGWPVR